jgi:hypothetical protein
MHSVISVSVLAFDHHRSALALVLILVQYCDKRGRQSKAIHIIGGPFLAYVPFFVKVLCAKYRV